MPNWKKVVVSGSDAHLNHITASGNYTGSGTLNVKANLTAQANQYFGTHDGERKVFIDRFSSTYPYAHIDCGVSDNNTAVGFRIDTRNSAGTLQAAFTITGSSRQANIHGAATVQGNLSNGGNLTVAGNGSMTNLTVAGDDTGACIFFGDGSVFLNDSGSLITRRKDDQVADTDVETVKYKKQDNTEVGSVKYNESEEKVKEHYLLSGTKIEKAAHTEFSIVVGDAANDANRKFRIDRDGNIKFNEEVAFTKLRQIDGFAAATDREILDGGMNGFN